MLAFTENDAVTLSMWLQAHAQEPGKFRCNNAFHTYYVVDGTFNPDMGICFGYDPSNDAFFISDNIPVSIRILILQIEWRRLNCAQHQSHNQALRISIESMPNNQDKRLLVITLVEFYKNLCLHFEHGEETLESRDVHAALDYLRSQSK